MHESTFSGHDPYFQQVSRHLWGIGATLGTILPYKWGRKYSCTKATMDYHRIHIRPLVAQWPAKITRHETASPEEYNKWIVELRRAKQLHTTVEDRLVELIGKIAPEYHPIWEPVGLAGGRNDLMLFEFSGRKVLFEIFATRSQVLRDLRILDKTVEDKKIAVIIDKQVVATVFDAFTKENPEDNYPFLFVNELFEEPANMCLLKLRELILGDEEAKFQRMLRTKLPREDFFRTCRKEGIEVLLQEDIDTGNVTFAKILITVVLGKCINYGIARERVRNLGLWLSNDKMLTFILHKIVFGLNAILYTDFVENFAIYSDIELSDWIRISYQFPQPFVIMSLNAVIWEIDEKYLRAEDRFFARREPAVYVGTAQVHETDQGKLVVCSIPKDTNSIVIIPPTQNAKSPDEYLGMIQIIPSGYPVVIQHK